MGSEYNIEVFEGFFSKKEIEEKVENEIQDCIVRFGNCGYTGTWAEKEGVDFSKKVFSTMEEADEFICKNNGKWDNLTACQFEKMKLDSKKMATLESLNKKNNEIKYKVEKAKNYFKTIEKDLRENALLEMKSRKSRTKTCLKCETKFVIEKLKTTYCVCCGMNLLSLTAETRILNLKAKAKKRYEDALKEEEKIVSKIKEFKEKNDISIGWVVGGWCSN